MVKVYTTPRISAPAWQFDAVEQAHILIGGTTGAGKSVALAGIIRSLLRFTPDEVQLVLIDPKGVELIDYDALPHSLGHFCDPYRIQGAISYLADLMEERFQVMARRREKVFSGSAIYVVIDEYVDLKIAAKRDKKLQKTITDIIRIACKGRAAKIHLIICTQRPTREIIDGSIRACLPCVLALRCSSAQESRNLIDRKGAEDLPLHGTGLYLTPSAKDIEEVPVPMVEESEMKALIDWWVKQA